MHRSFARGGLPAVLVLAMLFAANAAAAFPEISKSLITATSPNGGVPSVAIDGNTGGSYWQRTTGSYPYHMRFDFGAGNRARVTNLKFLPYVNFSFKNYRIYVTDSTSTDPNDWGVPAASNAVPYWSEGMVVLESGMQYVELAPRRNGRYLILQMLDAYDARAIFWEIWFYGAANGGPILNATPETLRVFAGESTNCAVAVSEPGSAAEVRVDLTVTDTNDVLDSILAGGTDVTAGGNDALTYTSPVWTSNLVVTASTNAGAATLRLTESDTPGYSPTSVLERSVAVEVAPRRVRLSAVPVLPMGYGQQLDVRLQIADAALSAPGAIQLAFGTPSGSSATISLNGDGGVADGARQSAGYIRLTASGGVPGVTEVTLAVDNDFVFEETGTSNLTLRASVISNSVICVATNGSNLSGDGTEGNPFRSLRHAIAATALIKDIRAGPGTYDAAGGEVFPVVVAAGVRLRGTMGAAENAADSTVVNPGGAAEAFRLAATAAGTTGLLQNLVITNFLGGAINATEWRGQIDNCRISGAVAAPATAIGIYHLSGAAEMLLTRTVMRNMTNIQTANILYYVTGSGSVTIEGCTFQNITVRRVNLNNHVGVFYFYGFTVSARDTLFDRLVCSSTTAQYAGSFFHPRGSAFVFERNIVRNINETGLIVGGNSSGSSTVRNCLFYNINANGWAAIGGYNTTFNVFNCTFNNCSAPFSTDNASQYGYFHNSSISDCTTLNPYASSTRLVLRNVNVRNTAMVNYDSVSSSGVTTNLPFYRNAAGGDFRLRVVSPLVDLGNNTHVIAPNTNDLERVPRILDGTGDATATVDIGCYEVNTVAPSVSTFVTPKPIYAMIAGTSLSVPVTVRPTATGTPVVANVAYGADLSGAATLDFPDGAGPSQLVVTADSVLESPGSMSVVSLTEQTAQGVQAGEFGILLYGNEVTVNQAGRLFLRAGVTNRLHVSLLAPGAVAPSQIDITPGSRTGSGGNAMAWVGNAFIPAGGSTTEGYLEIVGGSGINAFELTVGGGFKFTETGTDTLSIQVTGFSSPLYVDDSGNNTTGEGTVASPLRTITYALSRLSSGDTVRLLPGAYSAAGGETFPITPGGIRVAGFNPGGPLNPAEQVVDGALGADNLFVFLNSPVGQDGYLEGLTLTRSVKASVIANIAKLTLTNCLLTGVTSGDGMAAGILVMDNSEVTAWSTTFTNLVGRGAVGLEQSVGPKTPKFTARNCRFAGNGSRVGTVYCYYVGEPQGIIDLSDCQFAANTASTVNVEWTMQGASAVWMAANGPGRLYIERCTFKDGVGGRLFGLVRMAGRVSNSLFANNQASGGDMIVGYGYDMPLVNCTFAGNTGGYGEWAPSPNAVLRNCIVSGDARLNSGTASLLILSNVILRNTPLGTGYNVAASTNVYDVDPGLLSPAAGVYTLRHYSPAVDAGNNAYTNGGLDAALAPRVRDGNGDKAAVVDLGAYEKGPLPPAGTVFMVR